MTTITLLTTLLIFGAIAPPTTFISSAHIPGQAVNNQTDANPSRQKPQTCEFNGGSGPCPP